jgi:hypothetical protein
MDKLTHAGRYQFLEGNHEELNPPSATQSIHQALLRLQRVLSEG